MRVILSRKGFDSQYGGIPSPVLPDGTMASLPIPYIKESDREKLENLSMKVHVDRFDNVKLPGDRSVANVITECLRGWKPEPVSNKMHLCKELHNIETKPELDGIPCHLDPDLYKGAKGREPGWRGCFGQDSGSLGHLRKNGVTKDDLFLFFGWFCKSDDYSEDNSKHMLFGYLQIGEIIEYSKVRKDDLSGYEWVEDHPHIKYPKYRKTTNNMLFLAREKLSFDEDLPGWGTFTFDEKLVLTEDGMSRSKWKASLPFEDVEPTYHSRKSWMSEGGKEYFQSVGRGQEFVFPESEKIKEWAHDVIKTGMAKD